MSRFLVLSLAVLLVSSLIGTSLGVLAGKEMGGRERLYVGAKLEVGDLLSIGLDAYYPVTSLESLGEELGEVKFLELDPLILLALKLGGLKVYAGAGPIVVLDVQNFTFSLFSTQVLRAKAGLALSLGGLSLFAEGVTGLAYSPSVMTTGIYGVQGGIALGF